MFSEARDLMSHQNPSGKYEAILIEALELLLPALLEQKLATSGTGNRRIASDVKKEVWERDEGRCAYVGEQGRRCGSTWMVEFDHIEGVPEDREATADEIRCLCWAHNQLEAERRLGAGFMEERRREAAEARRAHRIEMKSGTRAGAGGPRSGADDRTRAGADSPPGGTASGTLAGENSADGVRPAAA